MTLSHLDNDGSARMVDISAKQPVKRTATATGTIRLAPETLRLVRDGLVKKGDVLAVARVAGIQAAKKTNDLIPLCHGIRIDCVNIDFVLADNGIEITATAVCTDKTGIEMEAMTAVSVAALTIYDMCKAADKDMVIGDIRLVNKTREEGS